MQIPVSRPFFIIGHPRSGTTLLRMILCSHPNIFIPDETGFLPFLKTDPGRLLNEEDIKNILHRIGILNYLWRDLPISAAEIFYQLDEPKLAALLNFLYQIKIMPTYATRWGDKTPLYIQYMRKILSIFPQAQFIHVVRDGRDAAVSARRKWGEKSYYMDLDYLIRNWRRNVSTGRQVGGSLDLDQYLEIRYEDLVTEPESTVRKICDFIEEAYEPGMLDQTVIAQKIGPGPDDHVEVLNPINSLSIGRWKTELSSFEKKKCHRIAGATLANFGYEVQTPESMTISEIFKFGVSTAKYIFFDLVRTLLYKSGTLTLNMNMRKQG